MKNVIASAFLLAAAPGFAQDSTSPPNFEGSLGEVRGQVRDSARLERARLLLLDLEILQGRIQVAGIQETLARPRGFVALAQTDAWCDMSFRGACFGLNIKFEQVSAYRLEDLLGYHRKALTSLEQANQSSREILRLLRAEVRDENLPVAALAIIQEQLSRLIPNDEVREAATEVHAAYHQASQSRLAATPTLRGDVQLRDPAGYSESIGRTASLLKWQLDLATAVTKGLSKFRETSPSVIDDDRSALDEAIADPRNTLMLIFGKPGSRAAEVHRIAKNRVEPWRKAFLITDDAILTPSEKAAWFQGSGSYVFLTYPENMKKGTIAEFDNPELQGPSAWEIAKAWARADQ